MELLGDGLRALVEENGAGASASADDQATVLIINVPIARAEGQAPERVERRAFLVVRGALELGKDLGVLYEHEKKYFREVTSGLLAATPKTEWREAGTIQVEVLDGVQPRHARAQSGLKSEGPRGAVIGAGAIGGTLLDLWTRSGWGEWTAIDNDHIKPHNIVRHPATGADIGRTKVEVARLRSLMITRGARLVQSVFADACAPTDEATKALEAVQLVVDASTTLEYPRAASKQDGAARHVSVFITPRGNGSVLLMEDKERHQRARTLEAQYYRAILEQDWGRDHLSGDLGKYITGASCRDISMVMPYSRILAHSATLAEQIQQLTLAESAHIRVWHHDEATGAVAMHEVAVRAERRLQMEDWDVYIDEGVLEAAMAMRENALPKETGGALLGYYDWNERMVVVVMAMAPPTDSQSSTTFFERGTSGLPEAVEEASRRTAGVVRYIGEWHSHPPGVPARPSGDDVFQVAHLALALDAEGVPALSMIVGEAGDVGVLKCQVG